MTGPSRRSLQGAVVATLALALAGLPSPVERTARAADEATISGTLEVEVRGTGAAPFGIASGITTGMGFGYNLARLQNLEMPTTVDGLAGSETYEARVRFELRADGAERWVLDSLTVTYRFVDGTTINYDAEARIVDAMEASGTVSWRDGRWSGTDADLAEPSMVFERGEGDLWSFTANVPHPARATGISSWTSPIGSIELVATDGVYDYSATDFAGNPLPLPMTSLDHAGVWSVAASHEQPWSGEGEFVSFDAYPVLTGADAYEILQIRPMAPLLYKVDRAALPGEAPFEVRAAVEGPAPEPLKWQFTLYDISCERGDVLNDNPANRASDCRSEGDYDMTLSPSPGFAAPAEWDNGAVWTIETAGEEIEVRLPVAASDYGAWARLRADVWIDDAWVPVRVEDSDKDYITLPRDEIGGVENHIADGWEQRMGYSGVAADLDDESQPVGETVGDGLSIYEEYRGFVTLDGTPRRTDPRRKTLIVRAEDASLLDGVRLLERASGLEVLTIGADQYTGPDDRVVNFNGVYAHRVDQHAVVARFANATESRACRPGEARNTGCGTLDFAGGIAVLPGYGNGGVEEMTSPGKTMVVLVSTNLTPKDTGEVVAHEIGHAISVQHHGDLDFRDAWLDAEGHMTACALHPVTGEYLDPSCNPPAGARTFFIAVPAGEHSGDVRCLMAYACADGYTPTGALADVVRNAGGRLVRFPSAPAQSAFCSNAAASAGNPVGPSGRGLCRQQFRISDENR